MNKVYIHYVPLFLLCLGSFGHTVAQESAENTYTKRVLETIEVDILSSYYDQDGQNAAVSGGIGSEALTDATGTFIVSIPLNADDVLIIDAGVSAYTSASSSNVDPFDTQTADPFIASSGASGSDLWANFNGTYTHASEDRNTLWSGKVSVASEYDYFSIGAGGSFAKLFNEKNTEIGVSFNAFFDTWNAIYPIELRPFRPGGQGLLNPFFTQNQLEGNPSYAPIFTPFQKEGRNSYSTGLTFSQIISKNLQGSLTLDLILQNGLLSTPFQRVYFADVEDTFIDNFQLADAIEQLPSTRLKVAGGGRLHYYLNEFVVLRGFYRYYSDDWGIHSHTASIEVPLKVIDRFTFYPSYRFYQQTASTYFAPYEQHVSAEQFYTSDFDLSKYTAHQYGLGVSYTDIFTKFHLWKLGLKTIDLNFQHYDRSTGLKADIVTAGIKFVEY